MYRREYEELAADRRLFRNKLSQFAELEAYEKYLN
jgi:hypothetical protein